jgi:hypothetical protein
MNERIRELMDESVRFRLDPDSKQYEAQVSPEELEMFAELIVRECIDTMYKRGEAYAHPSAGFYQAKTFAEAIMDYFGVKE